VTPVEFRGDLWRQETRVPGLSYLWCCLYDPTFSRFSRTPTSDGRTDRRTDGRTDTGPWLASRGKNLAPRLLNLFCYVTFLQFVCTRFMLYRRAFCSLVIEISTRNNNNNNNTEFNLLSDMNS